MAISPDVIERPELELSVVIPIYNEEGNIERLHRELKRGAGRNRARLRDRRRQ